MLIKREKKFTLEVIAEDYKMVITINGDHYCDFAHGEKLSDSSLPHRLNSVADTLLQIEGDVSIDRIMFE